MKNQNVTTKLTTPNSIVQVTVDLPEGVEVDWTKGEPEDQLTEVDENAGEEEREKNEDVKEGESFQTGNNAGRRARAGRPSTGFSVVSRFLCFP